MDNVTYNIRIDKNTKNKADLLYKNMGLSLSSAINLFLKQSIIQGKMPIQEIISEPYYAENILEDSNNFDLELSKKNIKIYDSPKDIFLDWENEDAE